MIALEQAIAAAGGLHDVAAMSIAGQQHGMVCLDDDGEVVRPALLWNDTRSAAAAAELVGELGGPQLWADAIGSVPVASFTITKLRWLATHEPESMARTASVCLPHDWLTWQWAARSAWVTDRGDASGTGYWSAAADAYRLDLLDLACGKTPDLPTVLAPSAAAGSSPGGVLLGPGTGDNAAAALGVQAGVGDVLVSIGTSGTVFGVSPVATADGTGTIAGFADASGRFLPLVCTLNATKVLAAAATMMSCSLDQLSELALAAPPGADGLTLLPYLDGERTPNRPDATGTLFGLTSRNTSPAHFARAAVEGMLCGLADGLDALREADVPVRRVLLIGGGARSVAVQRIAPTIFGVPVEVPEPSEYVADGAARQAAWVLAQTPEPPIWSASAATTYVGDFAADVRARYRHVRDL
jgi:xylulokinase